MVDAAHKRVLCRQVSCGAVVLTVHVGQWCIYFQHSNGKQQVCACVKM